jgi:DNA polymerase III subunit delta
MILFVHGEDTFLVGRRKRALVSAFVKKYQNAEIFTFDFEDQGTAQDVKRALDACEGGLFANEKMVVFLHPFSLGEAGEKLLIQFLKEQAAGLPERTILLFVESGKIKKTHPVTKVLLAKMDKEEIYDVPDDRGLRTLVTKELALLNENVSFDANALSLFLTLTEGDTARMMSELEKLATFKNEGVITGEDIETLCVLPGENNIWNALDTLGRGDRKQATLLLRREAEKGEGVYPVLAMCAWQVRRLLLIREAFDRGIRRPSDIASATKLPPFTVQKAMAGIETLPLSRLKQGLLLLSDIDTALKQGKADPEVSLDLFVWKF